MSERLFKLGFDPQFWDKTQAADGDVFELARVTSVQKESYVISNGSSDTYAEITGKMMFSAESPLDFPTVGDWCKTQIFDANSPSIIHDILPRRTELKRKAAGKKIEYQLIAANIDTALIVQALDDDFNLRRLERYMAAASDAGIEPHLLLSKTDLLSETEIASKTEEVCALAPNLPVTPISNISGYGLDKIDNILLAGKTYCLLGSSGVGKTTLLNHLLGDTIFKTQAVRESDGKGKHTTTNRQLLTLKNGSLIIDTPGMREFGSMGAETAIGEVFDDISELENACRFNDCTHTKEAGCAILEALENGLISSERFGNYVKLKKESAFNEMSYLEKKKRDKKLGKLYKSVQRNNIKN